MAPLRETAASVVERGRELVVVIRLNGPEHRLLRDSNTSEITVQADLTGARASRRARRVVGQWIGPRSYP
jgi:hypothetical protein